MNSARQDRQVQADIGDLLVLKHRAQDAQGGCEVLHIGGQPDRDLAVPFAPALHKLDNLLVHSRDLDLDLVHGHRPYAQPLEVRPVFRLAIGLNQLGCGRNHRMSTTPHTRSPQTTHRPVTQASKSGNYGSTSPIMMKHH